MDRKGPNPRREHLVAALGLVGEARFGVLAASGFVERSHHPVQPPFGKHPKAAARMILEVAADHVVPVAQSVAGH